MSNTPKLNLSKIRLAPNWVWITLPALLFVIAWEPIGLTPLLWLAFIPFFVLHQRLTVASRWKYFGNIYLALLGWNATTTWWVFYASAAGGVSMLILNTLFMCIPFLIWRFAEKKGLSGWNGFLLFTLAWVLYEYGHHRWDLSWPWLTLGNGLSSAPWMIQWYEWTGTLGGTLWVLWLNYFIYKLLLDPTRRLKQAISLLVLVPTLVSLILLAYRTNTEGNEIKVAVMQPSFNPWNEKFDRDPVEMQEEMQQISMSGIDSSTNWLLWPETSMVRSMDIDYLDRNAQVLMLKRDLIEPFPNLQIVTGFHGIKYYRAQQKPTRSARKSTYDPNVYYDVYNSALHLAKDSQSKYYHKSKLVPGTEQMPFIHTIPFLEQLAITLDENSITGSLGVSDSAYSLGYSEPVAPIICYESIYGDYVRSYVKKGATWLGIITNDAWWENTPGYHQHYSYAKLRAIEFRKWVARSANTGTSGFIDPVGNSYDETSWYAKTCIQRTISANNIKTLYLYLGDLGVLVIYSLMVLVFYLWKRSN